jgi:hypothetical protein
MAYIRVLGFQETARFYPGVIIIAASNGQPVISCPHNLVLVVYNAGAYLGAGILAAPPAQQGHPHKIFIPGDIIFPFAHGDMIGSCNISKLAQLKPVTGPDANAVALPAARIAYLCAVSKILASLQLALDTTFPTRETIKFY